MKQSLYELLRDCTVRISLQGKTGHGTGFFVAPGLILTCAHVVKDVQSGTSSAEVYWHGQLHPAQITRLLPDTDLALLQVNVIEHPCVFLQEEVIPFDTLYSYGYPDDHSSGDPATFTLEGKAGEQGEQLKFKRGQVRPGLSGAPILNMRTGYVCGVVQLTRDRASDLGGRAIPTSTVFRVFPEVVAQQRQFHQQDRRWINCLQQRRAPMQRDENRQRMLERVQAIWIDGFLEKSLYNAVLITLGLHEQSDAVASPWELVVQEMKRPARPLPSGISISQVYDDAKGELLILGEPGTGKTTLLLELARDLLDRAKQNDIHPMPVVFNLSSWAMRRQSIADWLIEELNIKYQVPRKLARCWIRGDRILPLFDGLDEVTPTYRTACIEAINVYRQEHGFVPTVVCSRSTEYLAQTTRLLLHTAVVIQPLTEQHIDTYLSSVGEQMAAVRVALYDNPVLQELAVTPLMLNILILTYHGKSTKELQVAGTAENLQRQVFATYVQHMLQRRGVNSRYGIEQSKRKLAWLGWQLVQHNQVEFYIERMQADWLSVSPLLQLYQSIALRLVSGLVGGLVGGLVSVLINTLVNGPGVNPSNEVFLALFYGFFGVLVGVLMGGRKKDTTPVGKGRGSQTDGQQGFGVAEHLRKGLLVGCVYGLSTLLLELISVGPALGLIIALRRGIEIGLDSGMIGTLIGVMISVLTRGMKAEIRPVEVVNWSWTRMWCSFTRGEHLRNGLFVGLVVGLVIGLGVDVVRGLRVGLIYGLIGLVSCLLVYGLFGGLSRDILDKRHSVKPNQGIWRSARNALLVGLGTGLALGVVLELVRWLVFGQVDVLGSGMLSALLIGLGGGLLSGLLSGGEACVKHFVLRFFLWRAKLVPWNYPEFLDYAAECNLLRKVGGGYIFVHRLLLDYFASLNITKTSMHDDGKN